MHLTPCALKAGRPVHSCWWGMCPGREPHRYNNNPHQRSSIGGTWLSTFILGVYESSLHPSITHRHGEEREKRGWFAKYKLTTNWSLPLVLFCFSFFFSLFSIFCLTLFPCSYMLWMLVQVHSDTAMTTIPFNHLSIHQTLQVTTQFQSHYRHSPVGPSTPATVTCQTVKQCDRLVTFPGCILPLAQSNYIQWWAFYPEIQFVSEYMFHCKYVILE